MLPVTTDEFHPYTWCGGRDPIEDDGCDERLPLPALMAIESSWCVSVIDPQWGRKPYLWRHVVEAVRGESDERYTADTPQLDTAEEEDHRLPSYGEVIGWAYVGAVARRALARSAVERGD